ncbi:MAG: DUF3108 domain-containing protein [Ignavibacteriales bacterium]|nr:DUF3108 domain-containing protein [Ignavibacteriales bacterium]
MKKFTLTILILVVFFFYAGQTIFCQNHSSAKKDYKFLLDGEDLTYVVRFGPIELGEVRVKVQNVIKENNHNYFLTIGYIDSYSGVPFVDLHQIYESKFDTTYYPVFFRGTIKGEEDTTFTEYHFDKKNMKVRVIKGNRSPKDIWTDTTGKMESFYQDGLSLFYYARMNLGKNHSENIPCFVAEKKEKTIINFHNEPEGVSIDAVDYDIDCIHLDGNTDFVSIFGLTGYFEGWFSNDEASIPIVAKMKVIIGNITLELKKWKRTGWNPPVYKD